MNLETLMTALIIVAGILVALVIVAGILFVLLFFGED